MRKWTRAFGSLRVQMCQACNAGPAGWRDMSQARSRAGRRRRSVMQPAADRPVLSLRTAKTKPSPRVARARVRLRRNAAGAAPADVAQIVRNEPTGETQNDDNEPYAATRVMARPRSRRTCSARLSLRSPHRRVRERHAQTGSQPLHPAVPAPKKLWHATSARGRARAANETNQCRPTVTWRSTSAEPIEGAFWIFRHNLGTRRLPENPCISGTWGLFRKFWRANLAKICQNWSSG